MGFSQTKNTFKVIEVDVMLLKTNFVPKTIIVNSSDYLPI